MKIVTLDSGTRLDLDTLTFIKKGSFGSVYDLGNGDVIKIYHEIDFKQIKKLQEFIEFIRKTNLSGKHFPEEVVIPRELAKNPSREVVGFTMARLPKGIEAMSQLVQANYRKQFRITPSVVAEIFLVVDRTVESVHQINACIGDFNYRNVFFGLGNPKICRIIDADSFAFEHWGSEGDEMFLAPELYGLDLEQPVFKPGHDWYSFSVMFFLELMLFHPFGGFHPKYRTLGDRSKAKISIFNKGVVYPKNALSVDQVLTNSLKRTFLDYFEGGKREPFPITIIQGYIEEKSGKRPVTFIVPAQVAVGVGLSNIPITYQTSSLPVSKATSLLQINGVVVYSAVIGEFLYLVADENGKAVYYRLDINSSYEGKANIERHELFTLSTGNRLGHFLGTDQSGQERSFVVVNPPYSDDLEVWEIGDKIRHVEGFKTNIFTGTGHAVFRTSSNFLYLMISSQLFALKIERGYIKRIPLRAFKQNQTWFAVDPDSETPRTLVFYINLGEPVFVLIDNDSSYQVELPALEKGEVMQEVSVKFDKHGILVMRQTEKAKKLYLRIETLDNIGKTRFSASPVLLSSHFYSQIHGRIYRASLGPIDIVLHPTSDGVQQEQLQRKKLVSIPTDTPVVDEETQLFMFNLKARKTVGIISVGQSGIYRIG